MNIFLQGQDRHQTNEKHMENGVHIIDPMHVYIDETVEISPGAVIYPGVILEGFCNIGAGAIIGAHSSLTNVVVGKGAHIRHSVLVDVTIGEDTAIGPFAYLRPGAQIGDQCKIGSFVEVKNANIANHTSVAHLAYIGDADVGERVNVGCGVITANYDGKNKHRTTIGNDVFVGSNANLIAPVTLGDNAFVAAGSTITKDVSPGAMAIARNHQVEKTNWKRPKDQ